MATIPELRIGMTKVADIVDNLVRDNTDMTVREMRLLSVFLRYAVAEMYRKPRATQAPKRSRRVTPAIRAKMIAIHRADPSLSQQEIGNIVGCNAGRVSEVLAGYRT